MWGCDFSPIVDRQLNRANALVESQRFVPASELYERILVSATDPKVVVRVQIQLAQIYAFHLNRVFDAVTLIKKAILLTSDPKRLIKLNEILGEIYFTNLRSFNESVNIYRELILVKPRLSNYSEYKYRYAESLFLSNDLSNALIVFNSLLENSSSRNKSRIIFRIALINSFLGKIKNAEDFFLKIIEGDYDYPIKVKSSFYLAGIYEDSNKLDLAHKYYSLIRYDFPNTNLINQKIKAIAQRKMEVGL